MNNLIEDFMDIIQKEINLKKQLFELLKEEQRILVSNDIIPIEKNIKQQDYIISRIKKLEESRIKSVGKISEMCGVTDKELRFIDIIELADEEYTEKLNTLMEEVRSVITNIININENNKYLIENGLEFVEENIKVFYEPNEKDLFYKKGGKEKKENAFRIVDKKV